MVSFATWDYLHQTLHIFILFCILFWISRTASLQFARKKSSGVLTPTTTTTVVDFLVSAPTKTLGDGQELLTTCGLNIYGKISLPYSTQSLQPPVFVWRSPCGGQVLVFFGFLAKLFGIKTFFLLGEPHIKARSGLSFSVVVVDETEMMLVVLEATTAAALALYE